MTVSRKQRFQGCLCGLAIGDALGGRFEAQTADHIRARFATVDNLIEYVTDEIWYTDDTQMAIGAAETLVDCGCISEPQLCKAFAANYIPSRGYGRGARLVIEAMEDGRDYRAVAAKYFPGGSYGNGAAMRVAPVGLAFHGNHAMVLEQARLSALPTHIHPLGIEGAQLIALSVAWVVATEEFKREEFFRYLASHCQSDQYRSKIVTASKIQTPDELAQLGNGIQALESVVTAIASFAISPHSYSETIGNVIFLGGDTDTLAAMAGAISGAYLGLDGIPKPLFDHLETSPKGRNYIVKLADSLLEQFEKRVTTN